MLMILLYPKYVLLLLIPLKLLKYTILMKLLMIDEKRKRNYISINDLQLKYLQYDLL